MTPADLQTPAAHSALETLTRERLLDLSPSFGIGLRGGRDTKARTAGRPADQLTGRLPTHLRELGRDEQIGAVYESLMGYHVARVDSPAARLPPRVWVETAALRATKPVHRKRSLKETGDLSTAAQAKVEAALESAHAPEAASTALADLASSKANKQKNRVAAGLLLTPGEERRGTGMNRQPRHLPNLLVASWRERRRTTRCAPDSAVASARPT